MTEAVKSAFDFIREAVILVKDGKVEYINKSAEKLFPDAAMQSDIRDVIRGIPDLPDSGSIAFSTDTNTGKASAVVSAYGQAEYIITVYEDGAKRYNDPANILVSAGAKMKNEMSVLQMSVDLMMPRLESVDDPLITKYSGMLMHSYHSLLKKVNDLSELEHVSEPRANVRKRAIDIVAVCKALVESVSYAVGKDAPEFSFISHESFIAVEADKERLEHAILKLLSNSLKYTPSTGKISVSVEKSGEKVRITVSDTGVGIEPEKMSTVFCKYLDGEADPNVRDGLGLGLAIVRSIIEAHGGAVFLESQPGKGTKVSMFIPGASSITDKFSSSFSEYNNGTTSIYTELSDVLDSEAYSFDVFE